MDDGAVGIAEPRVRQGEGAYDVPAITPEDQEASDWIREIALCTPGVGPTPCARFLTRFCRTIDEYGRTDLIPAWKYVLDDCAAFERGCDIHDEKTRQMLGTWLTAAQHVWRTMMERGASGFLLSRKEKLVDDGGMRSTPQSMFGRMRFVYNNLPQELKDYAPLEFSHLRMSCERTGSFVTGEGTTADPGRGGTFGRADVDEAARIPGSSWFASIRRACPTGLRLRSTPDGKGNVYADIKFDEKRRAGWTFLRKHWTAHPFRSRGLYYDERGRPRSPWYDDASKDMTDDEVARELDISYERSVSGQVWPEFDEDRHLSWDAVYDVNLPLYVGMDFGAAAATTACFFQVHGREMWIIGDYEEWNADVDAHAPAIWAKAQALGFRGAKRDLRFFGDPAGNSRELTNKDSTVIRAYQAHGFTNFSAAPRRSVKDGIRLIRRKLKRGEIAVHTACSAIRKRVSDYRYRTDTNGHVLTDLIQENTSTHLMDAIRYGAISVFNIDEEGAASILTTPRPLVEPVPFGRELDRHEERDAFRPIISGRREF